MKNLHCTLSNRSPDPADSTTLVLRWDDIIKDIAGKWAFRNYTSSITTLVIEVEMMFGIASSHPEIFTAIPATISTLVLLNSSLLSQVLSTSHLFYRATSEVSDVLTQFPETITTFKFMNMHNRLIPPSFLTALGSCISTLDLSDNPLYSHSSLIAWLQRIPQDIATINLAGCEIENMDIVQLKQVFNAFPRGLRTINLSGLVSRRMHMENLMAALNALPQGLTTLELSNNFLGRIRNGFFAVLPRGITTLNLSNNELGRKSLTELVACFKALPRGISTLNLSNNHFFDSSHSEQIVKFKNLSDVFKALPTAVSTLDLSGNNLSAIESSHFNFYIQNTFKSTVTFLNIALVTIGVSVLLSMFFCLILIDVFLPSLALNFFVFLLLAVILTAAEFFILRLAIYLIVSLISGTSFFPQSVLDNNMFSNTFRHVFTELWLMISKHVVLENPLLSLFSGLPSSVTTLKLGRDDLMKDGAVNKQLLDALPQNITTLHLSRADLFKDNEAIIIDFFNALPSSVTRLIVDDQAYDLGDCLLSFLVPELMDILTKNDQEILQRIVAMDNEPIKPVAVIDEILLEKCITFFENHPSPKVYLACALLMEGLIENYDVNATNISSIDTGYCQLKYNKSIEYYTKAQDAAATDDVELLNMVQYLRSNIDLRFQLPKIPDEFNEGKRYELCLMSSLTEEVKAMPGKVYLSDNGDYVVRDLNGLLQKGNLSNDLSINLHDLASKLGDPEFRNSVLSVTSNRGHTNGRSILGFFESRHYFNNSRYKDKDKDLVANIV